MLRPFRPDDFEAAAAASSDPAAVWVSMMPADDGAGVVAYYDECLRDGILVHLVIADRQHNGYLGEVMLLLGEHDVGELGCIVAPQVRGRGVAAEAFELLARWAFDTLGVARLQVFVAESNAAALGLAKRTAFHREGVLQAYWELDGARIDVVLLARIRGR